MLGKKDSKSRLGRGLGNLISSDSKKKPKERKVVEKKPTPVKKVEKVAIKKVDKELVEPEMPQECFIEVAVESIQPNDYQPRKSFDEDSIKELAESIRAEGLLQPVVIRSQGKGYSLIAGERRLRAFQYLNLKHIPARIIEASDASSAVMALIENLQRQDLNPIDESMGYASLMRDFNLTQAAVAERVGKGRPSVANALRLLQLDAEIQGYLGKGILTVGHAKVLLSVEESEYRVLLARKIIEKGMSVREAEQSAKGYSKSRSHGIGSHNREQDSERSNAIRGLENKLRSQLSTKVEVKDQGKKGKLVIEYKSYDDLERILNELGIAVAY